MNKGAPTGKWPTLPSHLDAATEYVDLKTTDAHLLVERPNLPTVTMRIDRAEVTIGRHANAVDLVLDDEMVSKQHAKLLFDPRGYFSLVDLESKNGIQYQGRVVRRLNLVDGDQFQIGKTRFVFRAILPRVTSAIQESAPGLDAPVADPILAEVAVPEPEVRMRSASGLPASTESLNEEKK